jgi:phosphomannomutase
MVDAETLRRQAEAWLADDPDPRTRDELRDLIHGLPGTAGELADRFAGPLTFGTAGLRGPVRAGPNGMNVAVVRRTTAGLAAWLHGQGHRSGEVVVGRDARTGSEAFARACAEVLAGAGFAVRVLPGPLPTPLVPFAVRALGAVAGVQITASHNPPADNGYKVYVGTEPRGAQLTAPGDTEIEAAIAAAPPAVSVPVGTRAAVADVREAYLDRVAGLPRGPARRLRVALTPLHGVGGETAVLALARAGFTDVHVVPAQAVPDAAFPTVRFPNPEEAGATDALLELAERVDADLAVALDPDADRCALGVPFPTGWRMLSGDETGVLLGDHILRHVPAGTDPLVATTVVSSSMLAAVAAAHGARFAETLTGFKWIVRAGPGLVYGYEEALGHCVDPDAVPDKDGIATAVLACDLAAGLAAAGSGLPQRLDELATEHGVHATAGVSVRMEPAARDAVVDRLRAHPPDVWTTDRPAPDVLVLRRGDDRVVVRPSGTEPKLKAYLQVVAGAETGLAAARADADTRLASLRAEVADLLGSGA